MMGQVEEKMVIYNVAKSFSCPKGKDPFGQWNTGHQDPWLVPGLHKGNSYNLPE